MWSCFTKMYSVDDTSCGVPQKKGYRMFRYSRKPISLWNAIYNNIPSSSSSSSFIHCKTILKWVVLGVIVMICIWSKSMFKTSEIKQKKCYRSTGKIKALTLNTLGVFEYLWRSIEKGVLHLKQKMVEWFSSEYSGITLWLIMANQIRIF